MEFYLKPTDSRKSFYKKAIVIEDGNITKLKSYDTIVAEYNKETKVMNIKDWYSATTMRHINSFLDYYGFQSKTKQQVINEKL